MFGLFRFAGFLVDPAQQIMSRLKRIRAILSTQAIQSFLKLSSSQIQFAVANKTFAQQHQHIALHRGIGHGLLQQRDGFGVLLRIKQPFGQFVLLFQIAGVVFHTVCVERDFLLL